MRRLTPYIHQQKQWPEFRWNAEELLLPLSEVRNLQGRIVGRMEALGFELRSEATLETLSLEVLKSAEIEGEKLEQAQVRSSVARKLGIRLHTSVFSDRATDGMVDMMLDAVKNRNKALSRERLFSWHSALFPEGRSGMYRIQTGRWRNDSTGPMQVVSGALGKEKVHFEAPDAQLIPQEMKNFLSWFNTQQNLDGVLKAGIAHLWFVTVHPFEDGNGRITRAITEMLLARSDNSEQRFYSMSAQIRKERKQYYDILEKTQKGNLDITEWLQWFLRCLAAALKSTDAVLDRVLFKATFWKKHADTTLNERQKKMLNRILDGLEGTLNSSKWAKMAKCSQDTAIRDINDLIEKGILQKSESGGRSTAYELASLS